MSHHHEHLSILNDGDMVPWYHDHGAVDRGAMMPFQIILFLAIFDHVTKMINARYPIIIII